MYLGLPSSSTPFLVKLPEGVSPEVALTDSKMGVLPLSPTSPLGIDKDIVYIGDPSVSFCLKVICAIAFSPGSRVVTGPASNLGVFPSIPSEPSTPGFPISPLGKTKLILYTGFPDRSSPSEDNEAEASSPFLTVPILN